jgi:bifunctional non-homologous end joining protein LigD
LRAGKLHFVLYGEKLHGEWSLVRMHGKAGGDGKNWLLIKIKDKHASTKTDVLADLPQSVKTARSLEAIGESRDDVWSGGAKETGKMHGAIKASFPFNC